MLALVHCAAWRPCCRYKIWRQLPLWMAAGHLLLRRPTSISPSCALHQRQKRTQHQPHKLASDQLTGHLAAPHPHLCPPLPVLLSSAFQTFSELSLPGLTLHQCCGKTRFCLLAVQAVQATQAVQAMWNLWVVATVPLSLHLHQPLLLLLQQQAAVAAASRHSQSRQPWHMLLSLLHFNRKHRLSWQGLSQLRYSTGRCHLDSSTSAGGRKDDAFGPLCCREHLGWGLLMYTRPFGDRLGLLATACSLEDMLSRNCLNGVAS